MESGKQAEVRQILIDMLEADIVGPIKGPNESIKIDPKSEYLTGVLHPVGREIEEEDKIREEGFDNDDGAGQSARNDSVFKPSSFGLVCRISPNTKQISIEIEYGTYEFSDKKFHRTPHSKEFKINLDSREGIERFDDADPKFTMSYNTKIIENGSIILSVYLVNRSNGTRLKHIMFQPRLLLRSTDDNYVFLKESYKKLNEYDRNIHTELLFQNEMSFGKGCLCSVTWDNNDVKEDRARMISTTFIPIQTVKHITATTIDSDKVSMVKLGESTSKSDLKEALLIIPNLYSEWISSKESKLSHIIPDEYIEAANRAIKKCRNAEARIRDGINVVVHDDKAFEAFKFANMAIAWQQTMAKWAKDNANNNENIMKHEPMKPEPSVSWRIFQLAFILLNIEPLVNPKSKNRDTVDLLWFPTGGGKTEAYLGLAAFHIAYRRLKGKNNDGNFTPSSFGTAVLMRYTLRLLTVQQFQRAATLMCACEKIRRSDTKMWGEIPFQAGLWVGDVTPNKRESGDYSAASKKRLFRNKDLTQIEKYNPYILINCPWCGKKLNTSNGEVGGVPKQWRLYCGRNECMFSNHSNRDKETSLPVVLVDEDVYSRCPSLIIGTVDKFAQITWKPETRSIFGRVNKYCEFCGFYDSMLDDSEHSHPREINDKKPMTVKLTPPDLIIQDELHLISGPLGSLVGMYETAIEHLCTNNGIKPKIVASTATANESSEQVENLFNRKKPDIFPPQVFKFGDTFFSEEDETGPGKVYMGVMGTGRSALNIGTRVSAVILRSVRMLAATGKYDPDDLDPYFTLVSYYNSLRELGSSAMSYKDSVPELISRWRQFEDLKLNVPDWLDNIILTRQVQALATDELTSRRPSGEIPDILRNLERNITNNPTDLLLATNMLSVGVDIPRLNVMIVNGQTKNHSEYIQATGRIGRQYPGLVITIYAYTRPRDVSHYEYFRAYHSALFKHVEPSTVTPFTARTRDIALFGVLAALIRMKSKRLMKNDEAGLFDQKDQDQIRVVDDVKDIMSRRVENIEKSEYAETMDAVDRLLCLWGDYAKTHKEILRYDKNRIFRSSKNQSLYYYLFKTDPASKDELIPTPRSLRSSEQEQPLFYLDDPMPYNEGEGV